MEAPPAKRLKHNEANTSTDPHDAPHSSSHQSHDNQSAKFGRKKKKGGGWRKRQMEQEQLLRQQQEEGAGDNEHKNKEEKGGWKDYVTTNELLLKYYRDQSGIVPSHQWSDFEAHLRMDLPSTFRITGAMSSLFTAELNLAASEWPFPLHQRILTILQQQYMPHFAASAHFKLGGLPWFPHGGAWQFAVPTRKLKRDNIAASEEADHLKTVIHDFHEFLVAASHVGAVTRQEAVSMIPPLFLDIQPHHWVLDLCAAPGSKTTQLIECLHSDPATPLPSGVVVANDVNPHRCNTLISQTKRLNSPTLLVTQHEAQLFPNPRGGPDDSSETSISGKSRTILYDRILCDVPCSGDGTIRKSPEVWGRWTPHGGLGLHIVQTRILSRAYHLLRPGSASRIVYSTCSLNPVEDEAVVAQVLLQAKGALELVDISGPATQLGLKWQAGLPSWRVMDKAGNWFESYDQIPEENRGAIQATHFPPENPPFPLNLERCCRFLPHLQDTGGFFVAVLQLRPESPPEINSADAAPAKPKRQHYQKPKAKPEYSNDPPFFFPPQETFTSVWAQLVDFFGILPTFPADYLMTRSNLLAKLYLVSEGARTLFAADTTKLIRFKHMGIRVFERMAGPNLSVGADADNDVADEEPAPISDIAVGPSRCGYRICQEAAHIMSHPKMTDGRRIVRVGREDLHSLFERKDMPFSAFAEPVKERLEKMEVGSLVFVLEGHDGICFAGWRGLHACHLRVSQMDKKSYSSLLSLGEAK
eukprot:TRINITY_DN4438_c0_g1_i1.p1 TRINITY_DN4438_c0_g1~~TRINITY_DN4438_c0_g1_i1.p1  ORF type:complete len:768 (-),score=125.01 TRINITY_DN4438_c0_g1_i1:30-2297(-)